MSRSVICVANTSSQEVSDGGTLALGNATRRYGCNCQNNGNSITLNGTGYYDISVTVVAVPSAAGTLTLTVYQDDKPLPAATASETVSATDTTVTLTIADVIARNVCCQQVSNISFTLSGVASTVNSMLTTVQKT